MKKSCIIIILLKSLTLYSQTFPQRLDFATPEVSAFNRFVEIPVSYFTGVPQISIPLYEVIINDVKIPISLDYHAGGIRVDQDATWVGLGWGLNFGGQISRIKRGMCDEKSFFLGNSIEHFLSLPNVVEDPYLTDRHDYIWNAKHDWLDYMPDEFYYSLPGFSGRFMFDQKNHKFVLFPKEELNIDYLPLGGNPYIIDHWKLKSPIGLTFEFGKDAFSSQEVNAQSSVSCWYIKSIINTLSDSVNFYYDNFNYRLIKLNGQYKSFYQNASGTNLTTFSDVLFTDARIRQIRFKAGRVDFIPTDREDLPTKALSEIIVKDIYGTIIRRIKLFYSYFIGDAYKYTFPQDPNYSDKRLRLDSLKISGNDLNNAISYKFDYYVLPQMPSKHSFSQDHWGYYNGISNPSLIPNLNPANFVGGDRRAKPEMCKVFSLKSITYPEGGYHVFSYEGNTALATNDTYQGSTIPEGIKEVFQDDNLKDKSYTINVNGYNRNYYYCTTANYTPGTYPGERFYRYRFTIPHNGYPYLGLGWECSTNFGTSALESNLSSYNDNVEFVLYKVDESETRERLRSFKVAEDGGHECFDCPRHGSDLYPINLSPGTYEMEIKFNYNISNPEVTNLPHNTNFTIKWREHDLTTQCINSGGVRIKEIKTFDNNSNLVLHRKYNYNHEGITSGGIVSLPNYRSRVSKWAPEGGKYGTSYYSNSSIPLKTTGGSHTGYKKVTEELIGITDTLKTEYNYSFNPALFSEYKNNYSTWMIEPKEWERGKLISVKYFKNDEKVREENYSYYTYSPHLNSDADEDNVQEINTNIISYMNLGTWDSHAPEDFYDDLISYTIIYNYSVDNFYVNSIDPPITIGYWVKLPYFIRYTGFDKLKSKTVTEFVNGVQTTKTENNYYYDSTPNHHFLSRSEEVKSDNSKVFNLLLYPSDYSNTSGFIGEMKQKFITGKPVETVEYITSSTGSELKIIKGRVNTYKTGSFVGLNDKVFTLKNSDPIFKSNFRLSNRTTTNAILPGEGTLGQFSILNIDPAYDTGNPDIVCDTYDDKGNILQYYETNDIITSIFWGYNQTYPVIKAENCDYATLNSVVTSLQGNLQEFLTNTVKDLSTTEQINAWKSFNTSLRNQGVLRNSLVTTYTYKPLIGLTSETDPNGVTRYYEYDGFGRLKLIRDDDGNILETYEYHYKP